jgi:hypothetical protein
VKVERIIQVTKLSGQMKRHDGVLAVVGLALGVEEICSLFRHRYETAMICRVHQPRSLVMGELIIVHTCQTVAGENLPDKVPATFQYETAGERGV